MTKRRDFKRIFDRVMLVYESARTLSLKNSCGGFYSCLGDEPGKMFARIVKPSYSDFICDVELAGKAVLDAQNYAFFKEFFLEQIDVSTLAADQESHKRMENNVIQTVGRELVRRRIHPMSIYFKGKEIFS